MVYIRVIWFCLRQLSLGGLWQSGAEFSGSPELQQRSLRHRRLKNRATRVLRAMLADDLRRLTASRRRPGRAARAAPPAQP